MHAVIAYKRFPLKSGGGGGGGGGGVWVGGWGWGGGGGVGGGGGTFPAFPANAQSPILRIW